MQKHFRESNTSILVIAMTRKRKEELRFTNSKDRKNHWKPPANRFHCHTHIPVPINTQALEFLIEAGLPFFLLRRSNFPSLKI